MKMNEYMYQRCPATNSLSPNTVLDRKRYHISYNRHTHDYGCHTTALVLDNTIFLILDGDHRKEYAELQDMQGCMDYFIEHIDQANDMSEHHIITGRDKDLFGIVSNATKIMGQENVDRLRNG